MMSQYFKILAVVVNSVVKCSVRNKMLVENECFHAIGRAVRYATKFENEYSNRTAYFLHSTSIMSLTGHSTPLEIHFSTNIKSLTGLPTRYLTTAIFCVFLLFNACKDRQNEPFLTVETTLVSFSAEQNSRTVTCSSNAAIEVASSHPAWCTVKMLAESKDGGIIEIKVSKNTTAVQERTATITVSAGKAKPVPIEVKQAAGAASAYFDVDAAGTVQQFAQQAGQRQFTVSASVPFTATSSAKDWCTTAINPDATVNNLTVSVTENDRIGARYAEIEVAASGFNSVKINVSQEGTGILADKPGMNIKGWVSCNGAGISGVAVSDGYEVTVTNADGVYYMASQKNYGFVFISTPGNYFPPVTDKIPQFFKRLNADVNTVERMDFELTAEDNDRHTVLAVTDFHLAHIDNAVSQFNPCLADMNGTINSYQSAGTKTYVITLGDLTWDAYWYSSGYALPQYVATMKNLNTGAFNTMGNHDYDPYAEGDWAGEQAYRKNIGPPYYSFNLGKAHYVVLDDMIWQNAGGKQGVMGDRSYTVALSPNQLEWLKKDLATVSDKSAPLFIAKHMQLYGRPNINNSATLSRQSGQQIIDCLAGFTNVHFLTGNTHDNYTVTPNYSWLMEHNTGAISATWWRTGYYVNNHINRDGSPGGYGVYEMNGKSVTWYYKGVGHDRNYQFRTYDLNTIHITVEKYAPAANATHIAMAQSYAEPYHIVNTNNEVLVNVWNYDREWKVEVSENGVSLPVTRVTTKDPLHIISYNFQRLNMNNMAGDAYTHDINYFFKVKASTPNSTLNIKVTDRFGNVYTETMTRPKAFTYSMK